MLHCQVLPLLLLHGVCVRGNAEITSQSGILPLLSRFREVVLAQCPFSREAFRVKDGRQASITNSWFGAVYVRVDDQIYPVCDDAGYAPFGFGYRSPLRGRVSHHWFLQGSSKKGVERKDRLHEAQHRPCRVVTGGTSNGCAGQYRLQEGAVTSPCVLACLVRTRKIQRYAKQRYCSAHCALRGIDTLVRSAAVTEIPACAAEQGPYQGAFRK